jgi:hypothetical protein
MSDAPKTTEAEVRLLARVSYCKLRETRPHMPHPDYSEGQRKIDRLFDILWNAKVSST